MTMDIPDLSPAEPPSPSDEREEDFMPLADVLAELKAGETTGHEAGNFPGSPGNN